MKRWPVLILSTILTFSLYACGRETAASVPAADEGADSPLISSSAGLPTSSEPGPEQEADSREEERILIAYFTWADNTVVEDPASVDVDATTSASVLAPGNAAKLAAWIQEEVGGDLCSIIVEEPYVWTTICGWRRCARPTM